MTPLFSLNIRMNGMTERAADLNLIYIFIRFESLLDPFVMDKFALEHDPDSVQTAQT